MGVELTCYIERRADRLRVADLISDGSDDIMIIVSIDTSCDFLVIRYLFNNIVYAWKVASYEKMLVLE